MPSKRGDVLSNLAVEVYAAASRLASQLHPEVQRGISALVRNMNCYYSNLIEGHNTHPRDIERALKGELVSQRDRRNLQLEAKAHIHLQALIDENQSHKEITTAPFIQWLHEAFYQDLPLALRQMENPDTGEVVEVVPGKFREKDVIVGQHIAPDPNALEGLMGRFHEMYQPDRLNRIERLIAAGASHHRLLWIHPFYDGNGRVARLFSHAYLKEAGVGSGLWSVARGFARNRDAYKAALAAADQPRQGDLDGRGNLSEKALADFCKFFLETCLDQIKFMEQLLGSEKLLSRIEVYTREAVVEKSLPKGSFPLLREALLAGGFARGRAANITGYKERQARTVLNTLIEKGLLTSDTPKGAVRLGFPTDVVPRWFPNLYPAFD